MGKIIIDKDERFTVVGNSLLWDSGLSLQAKGLAALLFSLGDGWEVSIVRLQSMTTNGETSLKSTIAELERAGYLSRTRNRDSFGQLRDMDYRLSNHKKSIVGVPTEGNNLQDNIYNINTPITNTPDNNIPLHSSLHSECPPTPYAEILQKYSELCPNLIQCKKLNDKRKRAMQIVWKEYGEELFEAFKKANSSPFLNGDNNRGWKADIEFVTNRNKVARILEGSYSSTPSSSGYRKNIKAAPDYDPSQEINVTKYSFDEEDS